MEECVSINVVYPHLCYDTILHHMQDCYYWDPQDKLSRGSGAKSVFLQGYGWVPEFSCFRAPGTRRRERAGFSGNTEISIYGALKALRFDLQKNVHLKNRMNQVNKEVPTQTNRNDNFCDYLVSTWPLHLEIKDTRSQFQNTKTAVTWPLLRYWKFTFTTILKTADS